MVQGCEEQPVGARNGSKNRKMSQGMACWCHEKLVERGGGATDGDRKLKKHE